MCFTFIDKINRNFVVVLDYNYVSNYSTTMYLKYLK